MKLNKLSKCTDWLHELADNPKVLAAFRGVLHWITRFFASVLLAVIVLTLSISILENIADFISPVPDYLGVPLDVFSSIEITPSPDNFPNNGLAPIYALKKFGQESLKYVNYLVIYGISGIAVVIVLSKTRRLNVGEDRTAALNLMLASLTALFCFKHWALPTLPSMEWGAMFIFYMVAVGLTITTRHTKPSIPHRKYAPKKNPVAQKQTLDRTSALISGFLIFLIVASIAKSTLHYSRRLISPQYRIATDVVAVTDNVLTSLRRKDYEEACQNFSLGESPAYCIETLKKVRTDYNDWFMQPYSDLILDDYDFLDDADKVDKASQVGAVLLFVDYRGVDEQFINSQSYIIVHFTQKNTEIFIREMHLN